MKSDKNNIHSGFAAIVGAPNSGKSTLLNKILGQKLSITSKKPQTTRDKILGIVNTKDAQIAFLDTPGIHKGRTMLSKRIVQQALSSIKDADVVLFVVDCTAKKKEAQNLIIAKFKQGSYRVVLALNKIDLVKKDKVYELAKEFEQNYSFKSIVPICAKTGVQLDRLIEEIKKILPIGNALFKKETFTDLSEKFMVKEIIREKIFRLTGMEIPHESAVSVDSFVIEKKIIVIHASIHVTRNSQKGIIIGKKGSMLLKIGIRARKDIEEMIGQKVLLKLFVKVSKNWISNARILNEFGY